MTREQWEFEQVCMLDCLKGQTPIEGQYAIQFCSIVLVSEEALRHDPIRTAVAATLRQKEQIIQAMEAKIVSLMEIAEGYRRYRSDGAE